MFSNFKLVYKYRELLRNLTTRDLKVRYRNSVLGFLWAWGNPIMMTLVFTLVFQVTAFSRIANYPLFIMIGWLTWGFTTSAIGDGINSVVNSANLVKKVWFPRIVLPASAVLANAANFLLAMPLIGALILLYRVPIDPLVLAVYFPVVFLSQLALVMGIAFLLSATNVYFRDTGVVIGVFLTAWFFLTPVFYSVPQLTENSRLVYYLNPMASIIEGYRNILYGSTNGAPPGPPDIAFLLRTLATALIVLLIGYLVFMRVSNRFGEEL